MCKNVFLQVGQIGSKRKTINRSLYKTAMRGKEFIWNLTKLRKTLDCGNILNITHTIQYLHCIIHFRSLSKLCLNSFWGKFGQRSNLSKDDFVSDPVKFSNIVFNEQNVVEHVRVMSDEMLYVTYSKSEEFVQPMSHTNPVIAAFTTANCRLKLYEELDKLQDRVAYFDTGKILIKFMSLYIL